MMKLLTAAMGTFLSLATVSAPVTPISSIETVGTEHSEQRPPNVGNVLRLSVPSDPITIDPGLAMDSTAGVFVRATFDGLTRQRRKQRVPDVFNQKRGESQSGKGKAG